MTRRLALPQLYGRIRVVQRDSDGEIYHNGNVGVVVGLRGDMGLSTEEQRNAYVRFPHIENPQFLLNSEFEVLDD